MKTRSKQLAPQLLPGVMGPRLRGDDEINVLLRWSSYTPGSAIPAAHSANA
jgi:hypothetical protein